jgi:hypothetical protein
MINWEDPDYAANGYFHNTLKSVSIKCADSNAAAETGIPGITGYQYAGNDSSSTPVVEFTNRTTIIGKNSARASAANLGMFGIAAVAAIPSLMMLL